MAETIFSWKEITWEKFEEISLYLISDTFNLNTIDKYYTKGYKQFGIDLIGKKFEFENDIEISVQCKKVEKFSKTDLREAVEEFLKHEFSSTSKKFIITVKTDTVRLTDEIRKYQNNEFRKKSIDFECWGITELETRLKKNYRIVFNYFGEIQASKCFLPGINKLRIQPEPIDNYIERQVVKIERGGPDDVVGNFWHAVKRLDLVELFEDKKLLSQHICLIADAYNGKSFFLKQLAHNLYHKLPNRLCPLFINIGQCNLKSIKQILDIRYNTWKEIPGKEIVVIIDGLDEVHNNEFIKACELINDFIVEYNLVHIIFSCRSLFYNDYNVNRIINQFELYQLAELDSIDIDSYLDRTLSKNHADFFIRYINKNDLGVLMKAPFNLINIVEQYKKSPEKLPSTKYAVIENYINAVIEKSLLRKSETGRFLKQNRNDFDNVVKKFALTMQLLSVNSISDVDFQKLFIDQKERDLLRHCPFISIANERHFFINAIFQEHLAAANLSKLSISAIEEICFIGKHYKKVKLKWVQTISSLLSSISSNNPDLYSHIISLLENDNIELLVLTENNIFENSFIKEIFIKILDKYVLYNIRPSTRIVQESNIASFVNKLPEAINILLDYIANNSSIVVKNTCWSILYYLNPSITEKERVLKIAKSEIAILSDAYNCKLIFDVLKVFKLHNKTFIIDLINNHPLNTKHRFREGVYELINDLELNDFFYDYGLTGIACLCENTVGEWGHSNSEYDLLELLFRTKSKNSFIRFLHVLATDQWSLFLDRHSVTRKEINIRICKKVFESFNKDSRLIIELFEYSRFIASKHDEDGLAVLINYFVENRIAWMAARYFFIYNPVDYFRLYAKLITPEQVDFFLFEYEEGNISDEVLRRIIHCSSCQDDPHFFENFSKLGNAVTENKLFPKSEEEYWKKYHETEKLKNDNNVKHLLSKKAFLKALKDFYAGYGKKGLTDDEVWIDADEKNDVRNCNSHVLQRFLIREIRNTGVVYLRDCLMKLDNDKNFNFFRATVIIDDNILKTEDEKRLLLPKLKDYYLSEIGKANFKNAITETEDGLSYKVKERLLADIFRNYLFDTPSSILLDMIWCDLEGASSIPSGKENKTDSLSLQIIKALDGKGQLELLKATVLNNLQNGISGKTILGVHLAIANYLKIDDVKGILLSLLLSLGLENYLFKQVLDFYKNLNGDLTKLKSLIISTNDFNGNFYFTLIDEMKITNLSDVINSLQQCIVARESTNDTKIRAAKYLASFNMQVGFIFLINLIRETGRAPYQVHEGVPIWSVETKFALKEIENVIEMVVDQKYKTEKFYESAQDFIIQILYGLSAKSESDLILVEEFLFIWSDKCAEKYTDHKVLLWHAANIVENFRKSFSDDRSIKEIVNILETIES